MDPFIGLDYDLVNQVLLPLISVSDLAKLCSANNRLEIYCGGERQWVKKVAQKYPDMPVNFKSNVWNWKDFYFHLQNPKLVAYSGDLTTLNRLKNIFIPSYLTINNELFIIQKSKIIKIVPFSTVWRTGGYKLKIEYYSDFQSPGDELTIIAVMYPRTDKPLYIDRDANFYGKDWSTGHRMEITGTDKPKVFETFVKILEEYMNK